MAKRNCLAYLAILTAACLFGMAAEGLLTDVGRALKWLVHE